MISPESIQRVLEVDLISVLEKVLPHPLKKKSSGYESLSPWTKEKTPSFKASQAKQVWKDFSSGKGGRGPISFIMQYQNKTWYEAVITVAELSNTILQYVELDDEEKERQERIEVERQLLEAANKKYRNSFIELPKDHWAKENFLSRGYDPDGLTEESFQIGYAQPSSNEFTAPLKEKGKLHQGVAVGLIAEKDKRFYDFFNDRLIFPILDERGRTIGFGGRASNEDIKNPKKKYAKYLNSKETAHYKKEYVLYGLYQARQSIIKYNKAYLTEGYTDVIGFHDKGVTNTVATCGTSLTQEHLKKLKRLCNEIVLVRDGDTAGIKAADRDIDLIVAAGLRVSIVPMPSGEDPDSMSKIKGEELKNWLDSNTYDAIIWKAQRLKNESKTPDDLSFAVTEICETLMKIKEVIKRKEYAKECAKKLKISSKDFTEKLETLENLEKAKRGRDKETFEDEKFELMQIGFPEDADVKQYKNDGYALAMEEKAVYFYVSNEKKDYFFKGANFICNPLFVIRSNKGEGKRLIEFENDMGEKTVFALNKKEVSNFSQFKETILDGYNFTFDGKTTNYHFTQFRNKMLYNFKTAHELTTLGQQPEGFWAFANGVVFDSKFWEVDEYGIVEVDIEEDVEEGIKAFKEMFYSPAFSKINLNGRDDEDLYEAVRDFVYKQADINFNQWMQLFYDVYGPEKGMLGIAFVISSVFRDIIVNQFGSYPYLFLTGQRQSGKTTFSESITNIFTPNQKGFDLNTGTMVGFFRRISRLKNVVVSLEEYTDQVHEIKFQSLKAGYDNRGRETGMATSDKNTSVTKVNSACIILSQYLSVRDDNSLTSRSITSNFLEQNYTSEEKSKFARLKNSEKKGLTSLIVELLKHRRSVEINLGVAIEEINRRLIKDLKGASFMERMLNNYICLLAPVEILFNKFVFPFKKEEFYKFALESIVSASDMISDTEGTATFWRTLEYLVDQKRILANHDFIIEPKIGFTIWPKKFESETYANSKQDKILFLRLGKVHQDYVVEVSKRKNEDPIGEATLRGYFKSKPYYIGPVKSLQFENGYGSCYAFNYTQMENMGVLNIIRDFKTKTEHTPPPVDPDMRIEGKGQEDLPF